jgi:hypothetical protein
MTVTAADDAQRRFDIADGKAEDAQAAADLKCTIDLIRANATPLTPQQLLTSPIEADDAQTAADDALRVLPISLTERPTTPRLPPILNAQSIDLLTRDRLWTPQCSC